jgi:hypothetical protein
LFIVSPFGFCRYRRSGVQTSALIAEKPPSRRSTLVVFCRSRRHGLVGNSHANEMVIHLRRTQACRIGKVKGHSHSPVTLKSVIGILLVIG